MPADAGWTALLRFYRGIARDLQGRRDGAVQDFEAVAAGIPLPTATEQASRCLQKACDRGEVLRMLKSLSLDEGRAEPARAGGAGSPRATDP